MLSKRKARRERERALLYLWVLKLVWSLIWHMSRKGKGTRSMRKSSPLYCEFLSEGFNSSLWMNVVEFQWDSRKIGYVTFVPQSHSWIDCSSCGRNPSWVNHVKSQCLSCVCFIFIILTYFTDCIVITFVNHVTFLSEFCGLGRAFWDSKAQQFFVYHITKPSFPL